jgi:hypothetical protein
LSTAASSTDSAPAIGSGTGQAPAGDGLLPATAIAAEGVARSIAATTAEATGEFAGAVASAEARTRTRWWVELLAVAWLCFVYDLVNNLAPLRMGPALRHGKDILHAETTLGISPELSLDRWLSTKHTLGLLVSYYYDNAHFIVTFALLGYLWLRRADIYRPLRTSLVLINVAGLIVFWLYPVAPPRMLDGFTDVVASSGTLGSWHTGALASDANQLAAMPSLHIAWALWCSVAIWRMSDRRAARAIAVVYPFTTGFAVMATGNHYVFDMLGGAILAVAVLSVVAVAPRTRLAGIRPRLARS